MSALWPAPASVRTLVTTRAGGVSLPPYDSFNLGDHVGDHPEAVAENRARLGATCPTDIQWLKQVHGCDVANAQTCSFAVEADACVAFQPNKVCAVLTADCLPVLFCDQSGSAVAAAHAGWRGLAAGVLENTARAMQRPAQDLMAWLGPAIGPDAFEVGEDVRQAFISNMADAHAAFRPGNEKGKYFADLYQLARLRLARYGIPRVFGGGLCTYSDAARFYSYRRDGVTGRMATLIWLSEV